MYKNGLIPTSALVEIRKNLYLRADAAVGFFALAAAFEQAMGYPLSVTDAYRSLAAQISVKLRKGKFAATPGKSEHGWGLALDLGSGVNIEGSAAFKWMTENAHKYGWIHPLWARNNDPRDGQQEPWHWEFIGLPAHANTAAKPKDRRDKPMIYKAGGKYAKDAPFGVYAHNGGWVVLARKDEEDALVKAGVPVVNVWPETLDNLMKDSRRR